MRGAKEIALIVLLLLIMSGVWLHGVYVGYGLADQDGRRHYPPAGK